MISSTARNRPIEPALQAEPIFKPDLVRRMLLAIFSGAWKAGNRLREAEVAAHFGVSRTPVREAFQELAAVGLVELRPNCGAVVAPFGPSEIEEIYEVRALLEAEAARLACTRIPADDLSRIRDDMAALLTTARRDSAWSERAWEADRTLHRMIAAHCPNRRLVREIGRYDTFVQIIRETVGNRDRAQDLAIEEHRAIIAALQRRNPSRAADALRRHIQFAGRTAVEAIRPNFPVDGKARR